MTTAQMVTEAVEQTAALRRTSPAPDGRDFIAGTVLPALEDVRAMVERDGATARVLSCQTHARLLVTRAEHAEYSYAVRLRLEADGAVPYSEASGRHGSHWRWSDGFRGGDAPPHRFQTTTTLTRDAITRHALAWYAEERAALIARSTT